MNPFESFMMAIMLLFGNPSFTSRCLNIKSSARTDVNDKRSMRSKKKCLFITSDYIRFQKAKEIKKDETNKKINRKERNSTMLIRCV